jgi:hypothetical protein
MPNGPHWRAAELHDLAAHAYRTAAVHHDKGEHITGHEHSKQAMEYATRAFQMAQEAHRESLAFVEDKNSAKSPAAGTSNSAASPRAARSGKTAKRKK